MADVMPGTSLSQMWCSGRLVAPAFSSSPQRTHGAGIRPQHVCRTTGLPFYLYLFPVT